MPVYVAKCVGTEQKLGFIIMSIGTYKEIEGGVTVAKGYVANALACGIKKPTATRLDLALVYSTLPTTSYSFQRRNYHL